MSKGKWSIDKLLRVIKSNPSGFYFDPYAWKNDNLKKVVKQAVKAGEVKTIRLHKNQIQVVII